MHAIRCVLAEWQLVRARLWRTRLGIWLLLLVGTFTWVAPPGALRQLGGRTGLLAGALCVAFAAGARTDRLALRTTLSHPTTPLALATGRWLAATVAACLAVTAVVLAAGVRDSAAPRVVLAGWLGGVLAAGGAAAGALPAVLAGGNTAAAVLIACAALVHSAVLVTPPFLYMAALAVLLGVPAAALLLRAR